MESVTVRRTLRSARNYLCQLPNCIIVHIHSIVKEAHSYSYLSIHSEFSRMGNILSDDGVTDRDMNVVKAITLETSYPYDNPIWMEVFEMKGYLQSISRAYLNAATTAWSHDMRTHLTFH